MSSETLDKLFILEYNTQQAAPRRRQENSKKFFLLKSPESSRHRFSSRCSRLSPGAASLQEVSELAKCTKHSYNCTSRCFMLTALPVTPTARKKVFKRHYHSSMLHAVRADKINHNLSILETCVPRAKSRRCDFEKMVAGGKTEDRGKHESGTASSVGKDESKY